MSLVSSNWLKRCFATGSCTTNCSKVEIRAWFLVKNAENCWLDRIKKRKGQMHKSGIVLWIPQGFEISTWHIGWWTKGVYGWIPWFNSSYPKPTSVQDSFLFRSPHFCLTPDSNTMNLFVSFLGKTYSIQVSEDQDISDLRSLVTDKIQANFEDLSISYQSRSVRHHSFLIT